MNENHNIINEYASSAIHKSGHVKAPACQLKTKKYESLLFEIANNFGFSNKETLKLIEEVYSYTRSVYNDEKNQLPLRILLSKVMVHKCIFTTSCRMFTENTVIGINPWPSFCNKTAFETKKKEMPLSYLTVYILGSVLRFSELEIAGILNTTTIQVRERLTKAQTITANSR